MKKNLDLTRLLSVKRKLQELVLKDLDVSTRTRLKTQADDLLRPLLENCNLNQLQEIKVSLPLLYAAYWGKNPAPRLERLLYQHFGRFYTIGEIDQIIDQLTLEK